MIRVGIGGWDFEDWRTSFYPPGLSKNDALRYASRVLTTIEVNGTFWHADPRFYDRGNLAPAQRRTIERYSRKVNILSQSGIKLAEIWEHDLKQSVSDSVDNALAGLIT